MIDLKYDPKIGFFGNIKRIFAELTKTNENVSTETTQRVQADTANREAVEQAITDLYLDGVQAQQDITDIQLQILEG